MKAVKMCASMRSSRRWWMGRRPRSFLSSRKACSISPWSMYFFGIAVGEVGAQKVGALVLGAGFADARPVELPLEGGWGYGVAFLGDSDGDELPGAAGLGFGDGEAGDEFVAGEGTLRRRGGAPLGATDAGVEGAQGLHGAAELLDAHGDFLEGAGVALGQDEGVALFAVFVHGARDFHADAGLDFLPSGLFQLVAEDADHSTNTIL